MQETDIELLTRCANEASRIAMSFFGQSPEVWEKTAGQGPVSEADLAIDNMLKEELGSKRPAYGWLSEETDDDPARLDKEFVFIVDPIDGTRSFINHHENFGVSLAIAQRGKVTNAVVAMPAKDLLYQASRGKGTLKNGVIVTANNAISLKGARILASGSQTKNALWRNGPPPFERHFRSSLAYRMCLVAEGRFDAMLTLRPTWEWDVAAGDLICQEAGATVTQRNDMLPRYNSQTACLDGIIAGPKKLHQELLNWL